MAALLHISRLRQALLSSARDAGEVLTKAFRADEASRVSQVVAAFLDGPHASGAAAALPTAAADTQSSSQVSALATDLPAPGDAPEQGKMTSSIPVFEPILERAASPRDSFAELRSSTNATRGFGSRLDESEGWFLTDIISGCEEGSVHAYMVRNGTHGSGGSSVSSSSSRSRGHGSMVMVSSVESLLSADRDVDDIDGLSSGGSSKDEEDSQPRLVAPIVLSGVYPSTGTIAEDDTQAAADLEEQMEQDTLPLLSALGKQCDDEAIYIVNRRPICWDGGRFYMIEAGHGWISYQSLEHLLSFLRETVKVFGADHLRKTKFLLPVGEAEVFLDELQKIVPYSLKDFFSAAKAASTPVLFALVIRFFFVQLTEAAVAWGAAAEVGAATAATASVPAAAAGAAAATAAAETAAAATGAASVYGVCSTAIALTPWVILIGGFAYGVYCGIRRMHNVRRKIFLCPTEEAGETEMEEGMPQGACRYHCIIKWG